MARELIRTKGTCGLRQGHFRQMGWRGMCEDTGAEMATLIL